MSSEDRSDTLPARSSRSQPTHRDQHDCNPIVLAPSTQLPLLATWTPFGYPLYSSTLFPESEAWLTHYTAYHIIYSMKAMAPAAPRDYWPGSTIGGVILLGQVLRAFVDIGYHLIHSYLDIGIFLLFTEHVGYSWITARALWILRHLFGFFWDAAAPPNWCTQPPIQTSGVLSRFPVLPIL